MPNATRFTLADLRRCRASGEKVPVLTCYDYTTATLMRRAGVPVLLVGDSAANVILGHPTTLPASLDFLIPLTAAVRRGHPDCLLMGDLPFGSYGASAAQGVRSASRMVQLSGCDCVKIEVGADHSGVQLKTIGRLADAGIAVVGHVGLRPQSVGIMGGYKAQGRTAAEAAAVVEAAVRVERAGAAAVLVEAVPAEVGAAVVAAVGVPVIGCGAGPACHGHVVVTPDLLGLAGADAPPPPRFVPVLGDLGERTAAALGQYVEQVRSGAYPALAHQYRLHDGERPDFQRRTSRNPQHATATETS